VFLALAVLLVTLTFTWQATERPSDAATIRAMPLGDSITEARIGTQGVPSYRRFLSDQLRDAGSDIDLVGSRSGVRGTTNSLQADPGGNWDKDHEGHWGWRVDEILSGKIAGHGRLAEWLDADDPDVLLIHLGSNDLFQDQSVQSTLNELTTLVNQARAHRSTMIFIVSTLIPSDRAPEHQPAIDAFNAALPGWVASRTTGASPVILVDSATGYDVGWNYDGIHPAAKGQRRLATRFADALLDRFPPGTSGCPDGFGYFLANGSGEIWGFGSAQTDGKPNAVAPLADLAADPAGCGYWTLHTDGTVDHLGGAPNLGGFAGTELLPDEVFTALSASPTGRGLWGFTNRGRVVVRGDARLHSSGNLTDLLSITLQGPILDSVVTPDGDGYYMLGADGGVFTFGAASFAGSLPALGVAPNQPAVGLVPDPDGSGYWIVAADGGVFGFLAPFQGSLPSVLGTATLNAPIAGMVPYGDGYLQVAADGGVFNFSSSPFLGSLGSEPPQDPIVAIAPRG
jgi:lysophospholipase L1-like esterase